MFSDVLGDQILAVVLLESDDRDCRRGMFASFILVVRGSIQPQNESESGVVSYHSYGRRDRIRANHVSSGWAEIRMEGTVCRERGTGSVFCVFDVDVSG